MLNATFNPNPAQKKTIQTLPAVQKQGDRVKKVSSDQLPADQSTQGRRDRGQVSLVFAPTHAAPN
jgi:hypothetical protein